MSEIIHEWLEPAFTDECEGDIGLSERLRELQEEYRREMEGLHGERGVLLITSDTTPPATGGSPGVHQP